MANFIRELDIGGSQFNFHKLDMPQMNSRKLNYVARTGVDGYAVWQSGYRGEPFTVTSCADFESLEDASTEYFDGYLKARAKLVELVWEDDFATKKLNCFCLDVQKLNKGAEAFLVAVGGLVGDLNEHGATLKATWTLLGRDEVTI